MLYIRRSFIGLVLAASLPLSTQAGATFRSGVYGGVHLGWRYDNMQFHELRSGNLIMTQQFNRTSIAQKKGKKTDNFSPDIFMGYRSFIRESFLGAELAVTYNLGKQTLIFGKTSIDDGSVAQTYNKLKGRYDITPSLVVGRTLNNQVAIYGRLGVNFSKYKFSIEEHRIGGGVLPGEAFGHRSKFVKTFLLGGGIEIPINYRLSTKVDISHSFKNDLKINKLYVRNTYYSKVLIRPTFLKLGVLFKI